ncbi:mitochondrial arginine transporter BAC2 [Tanacetum coccineum]
MYGAEGASSIDQSPVGPSHDATSQVSSTAVTPPINHNDNNLLAYGRQDNYVYVSEALMAGIAAGAVESLMSSPFELFTIRSQVTSASRVPKSSTALQITSASSSIAKVLRGYTPDVKALNHSVGLLSTLNTIIIKMVSNEVFWCSTLWGDVTIPKLWAHTGLWLWQRNGKGHEDELPLESDGQTTQEQSAT